MFDALVSNISVRCGGSHGRAGARRLIGCTILALAFSRLAGEDRAVTEAAAVTAQPTALYGDVRPLVDKFCIKCHSEKKQKGHINLEQFKSTAEMRSHIEVWEDVLEMVGTEEMPPEEELQPSEAERMKLTQWIRHFLGAGNLATAGDPGAVVLRRLDNVEYRYTMQDLIGIDLDPVREFPADGAAGEGFMNTGESLVMSPSLLDKYLATAKQIASHAVLLPDGIRFSSGTNRQEWTDNAVARIRDFYAKDTDANGAIPLERYLAATIEERSRLARGDAETGAVAAARELNARYLGRLFHLLGSPTPSPVLDPIRAEWQRATQADAARTLAREIKAWQQALFRFDRVGNFNRWIVPLTPLAAAQPLTLELPAIPRGPETAFYLEAGSAGERNEEDVVVWQRPRFAIPNRPEMLLRDVGPVAEAMARRKDRFVETAAQCLAAIDAAGAAIGSGRPLDMPALARRRRVDADLLAGWLEYFQIGSGPPKLDWLAKPISATKPDGAEGWSAGTGASLRVITSVDPSTHVRRRSVTLDPAPNQVVAVGWASPLSGRVRIDGRLSDARVGAGDGVGWALELRRGTARRHLADGLVENELKPVIGPFENVTVQKGDLIVLTIDPISSAVSDLTNIDLAIASADDSGHTWNLAADIGDDVRAGNPHADTAGHERVWHFFTEPATPLGEREPGLPLDSALARWRFAENAADKARFAEEVTQLLAKGIDPKMEDPRSANAALFRQLMSLGGPLAIGVQPAARSAERSIWHRPKSKWGLQAARFGPGRKHADADAASVVATAPELLEVRLPSNLVAGCTFKTTAVLDSKHGANGAVQVQLLTKARAPATALVSTQPILVNPGSANRAKLESAFAEFRDDLPAALCYRPVLVANDSITLERFFREDDPLARLMLDAGEKRTLDRNWDELHFVAEDAVTVLDAYKQQIEEDADIGLTKHSDEQQRRVAAAAEKFRAAEADARARHLDSVLRLATQAFRRPLAEKEETDMRGLYDLLRQQDISHGEAIRLLIARLFVSPAFLYRIEQSAPGAAPAPVSPWEAASRLSYFLWSSMPDEKLRREAAAGRLNEPDALARSARRLATDDRVRALATEFATQWLHVRDFETLDEKSERVFPTFAGLRRDMYEETVRFFVDLFEHNGSILKILDADYTYLDEALAEHYGIPGVKGPEWRRVEGVKRYGRGGVIGMAAVLAKQSGASRTSPILRGNWVMETLLGDKLPDPPPNVPQLPENESDTGLTIRQITERHTSAPECASCHVKFDAFGFALEKYDAIGRRRESDQGGRPIDVQTELPGKKPASFADLSGLRDYILANRQREFVRNFCRKLLGFALARRVQPSDYPLLDEMQAQLARHDYQFLTAVETIVRSPQFRERRGLDAAHAN